MIRLILSTALAFTIASCNGKTPSVHGAWPSATAEDVSAPDSMTAPSDGILPLTIYSREDSLRVVDLLKMKVEGNDMLFYARQLIGLPYVGGTLEQADPERLVVNLRELDCTTLVETVMALSMTSRSGSCSFTDYCRNLEKVRYRGGRMNGYLSRLHYFTWWMHDNMDKGLIREVKDAKHFTAPLHVNNYYMSRYPEKYRFLKGNRQRTDSIAALEKAMNGPDGTYLPESKVALGRQELGFIRDGDIVAIVTRKAGLDYSHLGIAVWGKDGRLHLLNASSIRRMVVEEPKTLYRYLKEHPSSVGIRLFRLND